MLSIVSISLSYFLFGTCGRKGLVYNIRVQSVIVAAICVGNYLSRAPLLHTYAKIVQTFPLLENKRLPLVLLHTCRTHNVLFSFSTAVGISQTQSTVNILNKTLDE